MYRKIATGVVTALILAATASAAVSAPRDVRGFTAAEKAQCDRASAPSSSGS